MLSTPFCGASCISQNFPVCKAIMWGISEAPLEATWPLWACTTWSKPGSNLGIRTAGPWATHILCLVYKVQVKQTKQNPFLANLMSANVSSVGSLSPMDCPEFHHFIITIIIHIVLLTCHQWANFCSGLCSFEGSEDRKGSNKKHVRVFLWLSEAILGCAEKRLDSFTLFSFV